MKQENCESTDMSSSRFRRIHLLLGSDQVISGRISENASFDCIAWNQNANANECFALHDLIVLTGNYHIDGHENRSVSVALQIQSIYVEGQKVRGFDRIFRRKRYQKTICSRINSPKETKPVKSRHFVFVGGKDTGGARKEQL